MPNQGTQPKWKVSPTVSRRELVASVGVGTSIALAGCAGGDDETSQESGGSDEPEEESGTEDSSSEKMGGHLRVTTAGGHNTLNPILHGTTQEYISTEWMYNNLTQLTPDLNARPDLATSWEPQNGGETWIFELHEDAQFHDGSQVLAEDVKASIEATQNPDFASPAQGALGPIDGLEVVNDKTVQVNLTAPYGDIPKKMAKVRARIVPKSLIDAGPGSDEFTSLENEDHGSGAFILEEFSPGNRLVFVRNENYWKEDDDGNKLPYLDRITQLAQPEPTTRVNSMRDRSADHYYRVGPDQVEQLDNMEHVGVESMPAGWFYPVIFRTDVEPFSDVRVRQAIKYAVNKEEMIEVAARGQAAMGQHTPISPAHQYYTDLGDPFGTTAEVEQAQELMNEAGYGDGVELDFDLHVSPAHGGPMGPMAVLFKEQVSRIGIEFEITRLPWSEYVNQNQNLELVVTSWGMRPIEDGILTLIQVSDGGANYSQWSNEEFDQAVQQAMIATEQETKQEHYTRAQEISNERAPHIIPFFMQRQEATATYEHNFQMEPTGFRIPAELIWLDSDAPQK
jgi:peptide/nickel transport system substrate-binding protein